MEISDTFTRRKEISHQAHLAQSLNYLKATKLPLCLLINFGNPKVEIKKSICQQLSKTSFLNLCLSALICG